VCTFTDHKVDGCGAEMERRYLLEHQQKLCSKTLMTCEYGCFISPSVLSSSLTSPYEQVILSREAMMKHNEECLTRHCHTMMKRLLQLERSIKQRITQEVKSKVDVLHQTMVELFESKLAELSITPSSIPSSLSSTMSTSNSTISGDTNNIIHNERHVQQPMLMMPTVILLGGENDKVRARNCVYGLYGKDWEYIIDLPHSLGCTTACRLDDRIYVMGGKLRTKEGLNDIVYMLHIPTWKWSVKAKMKQTRWGMTSVLCGGRIYVMGGMNKSTLKSVEIYHSVQDTWSPGPHMLRKRHLFASVSIGTQIFVFGGDSNDSKDSKDSKEPSAEVLDTTTNKWSFIAKPLSNRDRHIAISPNSDTIWILGGVISKGTDSYLRKVEEYRISTNTWSILSWCLPKALSLASAYYDATNEQVIIIGGYEEGYGKDNQQLAQSSTWSINKASGECINLSSLPEPLFASGFVSLL
jgi:N-acetylneuraminic acid mutarotase